MIDFFLSLGYAGLFGISFLAATVLPFSSELVFMALFALDYNPIGLAVTATIGNYLGAVTNYYAGQKGASFIFARWFTMEEKTKTRAESLVKRWGPAAMILSWLPGIGDPLTAVAGIFNMPFGQFSFWVLLGKALRYIALLYLSDMLL